VPLSLGTVIVAHTTFCMVTVLNNMQARLRQMDSQLEEASADLGAGVSRTFWSVTFPQLPSALLAGALLSFALSFDEIIVTTFTIGQGEETLPVWILQNLFRPNQAPVVNVVAVVGEVVSQYPMAGGIYPWARRLWNRKYAWIVSWVYLWAVIVTVTAVAEFGGNLVASLFGIDHTPRVQLLAAVGLLLLSPAVNFSGTQMLARPDRHSHDIGEGDAIDVAATLRSLRAGTEWCAEQ
jgi:Binding-protein-dependent transport system inner membrane component/Amino acid permease